MTRIDCDIGIVGAGVSGLAAASVLRNRGLDARCFEATDRIGGRILTVHDPTCPSPIELGAEFVHGRPREILDIVESSHLKIYEHSHAAVHIAGRRIVKNEAPGALAGRIFARMAEASRQKDLSFDQYLSRLRQPSDLKSWARLQVEGFNAARSSDVSVGSLVRESKAADEIGGDSAFRILEGYDSIPHALARAIPDRGSAIFLHSIAQLIRWRPGSVEVVFRQPFEPREVILHCRQLIITVPLGILQAAPDSAGAIQFDPEPTLALRAARCLQFGHVNRVTLRFRDRFWEENEKFRRVGYFIARDEQFFAWWPTHPLLSPLLIAWMAGSATDHFHPASPREAAAGALQSLKRIMKRDIPKPEAFYFHDWQGDPFSRGAYSYVPLGGHGARETLAKPVSHTLFFAGEAAETGGHASTVHGAIATGRRAAQLILNGRKEKSHHAP
jgi:monoamine oxidase